MINQMKKSKGIALIPLIVTIIVMLILAGVVLNLAIRGDNTIIKKAQETGFSEVLGRHKEELEIYVAGKVIEDRNYKQEVITASNEELKTYLPSILDEDLSKFEIIQGELYYVGNDDFEKNLSIEFGYKIKDA